MHGLQTKRFVISLLALLIIIDRGLKIFFWHYHRDAVGGLFFPTLNTDAAFSVAVPFFVWWPISLALFFYCLLQALRMFERKQNYWPWMLICIGASSNIFDRLFYGGVIDYLSLGWWPVFNLSDTFIVCSVIWLVVSPQIKLLGHSH